MCVKDDHGHERLVYFHCEKRKLAEIITEFKYFNFILACFLRVRMKTSLFLTPAPDAAACDRISCWRRFSEAHWLNNKLSHDGKKSDYKMSKNETVLLYE